MSNKIENRPLEIIKKIGIFNLSDNEGSCCCLSFYICGVNIYCHCHRCGNCCKYSGIHCWSNNIEDNNWNLQEIAEEVHRQIIEIWPNIEFEIKYEPYL